MSGRGVPEQVAEHRGDDAQKEQVAPDGRPCQNLPRDGKRPQQEDRQDGHHAVEEDLAGDEERRVALADALEQQRVADPRERGAQRQQVALRLEVEDEAPVEHHQRHPGKGDERPDGLPARHPLAAVERAEQQGGPQRRRADYQRDVRCRRELQRHVLGQEVERAPRDAGRGEHRLVAQAVGPELRVRQGQQQDVGRGKAHEEDFGRGERVGYQHLGRHEGGPPHRDAEERREVVAVSGRELHSGFHAGPKLRFFATECNS